VSVRPAQTGARLPRAAGHMPSTAEFNAAMQQIEQALNATVQQGTTPALPGLILTAADGSSWRVLVQPDGSLTTSAVSRA
jgi:hypothetical protein